MNGSRFAQSQRTFISKIILTGFIIALMICSVSQSFAQTTVVIDDIDLRVANPEKLDINLKIYPNPAYGKVVATVDGAEQIQAVKIIDLSGRSIQAYKPSFMANSYKLDISSIPSGTYILQIKTELGFVARKLSVAKS